MGRQALFAEEIEAAHRLQDSQPDLVEGLDPGQAGLGPFGRIWWGTRRPRRTARDRVDALPAAKTHSLSGTIRSMLQLFDRAVASVNRLQKFVEKSAAVPAPIADAFGAGRVPPRGARETVGDGHRLQPRRRTARERRRKSVFQVFAKGCAVIPSDIHL
jgi:hypothetical protein